MPLAEDIRECPVTWTLAASWVVVFATMLGVQFALGLPRPRFGMGEPLGVSSVIGHRFGDLTWAEIRHGEAWRLITATFVHFGLIHITLNLIALIKLGQLIEPWYGSGPFLAICLAIGGVGNLIGGLLRVGVTTLRTLLAGSAPARIWPSWFETSGIEVAWRTPSGGGSTVLLGLVGLGAVVGWRAKTRIGSFLRDQMVLTLAVTALLGFLLINLIDNYGHAGGAIVGGLLGLAHRPLVAAAERSRAYQASAGTLALALVGVCLSAAIRDERAEARQRIESTAAQTRFRRDDATLGDLDRVASGYGRWVGGAIRAGAWGPAAGLDPLAAGQTLKDLVPPDLEGVTTMRPLGLAIEDLAQARTDLGLALNDLATRPTDAWGPDGATALDEVRDRGRRAVDQFPTYPEIYAFTVAWRQARALVRADRDQAKADQVRLDPNSP